MKIEICRNGRTRLSWIVFLVVLVCLAVGNARGDAQGLFTVRSTYLSSAENAWERSIDWTFSRQGGGRLSIGRRNDAEPLVEIGFDTDGRPNSVNLRIGNAPRTIGVPENGIVLSRGHAAPYDQLFGMDSGDSDVTIEQFAGGTMFVESLTRTVDRVAAADLPAAPDPEDTVLGSLAPDEALIRIRLKKGDTLVVEQVWREDDNSGWIFEQTPVRRSWRLKDIDR